MVGQIGFKLSQPKRVGPAQGSPRTQLRKRDVAGTWVTDSRGEFESTEKKPKHWETLGKITREETYTDPSFNALLQTWETAGRPKGAPEPQAIRSV